MDKTTSAYLDLVRFLAALVVLIVHIHYILPGGVPFLWRFAGLGGEAVFVFFVLSGFVIAFVAETKESAFKDYLVSRLARLYSVAAPALVLTLTLDYFGARIDPAPYAGLLDSPIWRFVANFFFLNEIWFSSVRPFSNIPFWSLGYEFWYYLIFAAGYYLDGAVKYLVVAAVCLFAGPKILILLPVWLLGVLAYFIVTKKRIGESLGWILFVGSVAGFFVFKMTGCSQLLLKWTAARIDSDFLNAYLGPSKHFMESYAVACLVALHFIGFSGVAPRFAKLMKFFEAPIRYLAGYTFALYLFHYPLLQFLTVASAEISNSSVRSALVLFATLGAIWGIGTVTEKQKENFKRAFMAAYNAIGRKTAQFATSLKTN
jgi:peptidoglycan/LPS O-acetylase OafA/YrhL